MSAPRSRSREQLMASPGLVRLARDFVSPDWDITYGTPENAVRAFLRSCPELAGSAADALDLLLAECSSDAELYEALDGLDWGYGPEPGRLEPFLVWVRDVLRPAAGRSERSG
jgi:hypothetical protein